VLKSCGIDDIVIIGGWCAEKLENRATRSYINPAFDNTNMVATLFCAAEEFDGTDDLLICYSDIVYEPKVISAIMDGDAPIATIIDKNWQHLWELRMENPLEDAETLKLENGFVKELGKKPQSMDEVEGQYIGIVRVSATAQEAFKTAYSQLPEVGSNGKHYKDIYMTDFLQHLIDAHKPIKAVCIEGGWLEVDTLEDISRYERALKNGTLNDIVRLGV